ncbi:MAG: tetratricopeptide repeat protein [Gammaproteobacteria bacterium]|jgi:tetratricopeptide (TPR) repeat protein|nr:tetratricopeptide repeat protein [Gammaproteobacteria bacterium]MBT3860048.1 tetratricopeptide repeat protein [Gammaproteobacteria bacterium]MBT3987002.1 tetratricopeptide repeat protein [Gammaproteobacteria bacterium]MBT4255362.1 tetratricopeptide repeat protein [Gammaproteobacteria bacterium]MBT4580733.1 tetratricopeptide repeat protein [Gammaproteobacteria bacterium]
MNKYLSSKYLRLLAASGLFAIFLTPATLTAQVAQTNTGESALFRGEQLLLTGSYAAASDIFQMADGLDRNEGLVGASRAFAMMGNYQEAMNVVEAAIEDGDYASSPFLSTQLAEIKRTVGESEEALNILQAVVQGLGDPPVRTLVQYGSVLKFRGDKQASRQILGQAVDRYNDGLVFSSEDVAMVALASWLMDSFHDANSLFNEATRANPNNLEAHVLWGNLFLEKYNATDAERSYQEALDLNSRYTPALVGIASVVGDERALQRALAINPNYVPAMETYAQLLLLNGREQEAQDYFTQALALNPESLKTLSTLASQAMMEEQFEDYERYLATVEGFSPGNPQFLGDVADTFGKNYRFDEAVEFARASIDADPEYWQGYTVLGGNLIRLGEEDEGRRNLEIGFENDPFNVMTSNMLTVFDTLATYRTLESEHFKVHMSDHDADILWPYLEPLLEEGWDTLTEKYGFEPEGPILIEVFEDSQDFAVRSVGLPDIGPLVGICFGKVVTLISPDTLSANWQEIVWHEFMHVITLQMTANRMPRWLSEGISVWEEKEGREYWGRDQGLDLVRAAEQDKLLHVEDLDSGFSGARSNADLGFAYFQAYLVVDYITEEYGFEKLVDLVKQYAFIKEDGDRFNEVFDQSLNQFDSGFRGWIDQRVAEINVYVHTEDVPDEGEGHGHGVRENSSAILAELYNNASLKQHMSDRIEDNPRDFQAHLQLGIVLFKEESFLEAKQSLEAAYNILPSYTGYPSPPLVLSQIYEQEGNREAQLQQLEVLLQNLQHDYGSAMILADAALEEGDFDRADYYIDRAIQVDPYRSDVHQLKAKYAEEIGDSQLAVTEYEVLLKLEVDDPVEAQTNLAEAYLRNGQALQAKENVLSALETAPSYQRAQQILLQAVDGESIQ